MRKSCCLSQAEAFCTKFVAENRHTEKGFTLIEVMVVIVIISLFSALLFRFYFQSNATQTKLIGNLQMQSAVVTGVNKTLRAIRTGTGFLYPALDEESPILIFTDFENNHKAIFTIKNHEASKKLSKDIFDLYLYTTDSKTINPVNPAHEPKNLRLLTSDVEDISFRLSSANSVVINFKFQKNEKAFQIVSEGSLMNSGEVK